MSVGAAAAANFSMTPPAGATPWTVLKTIGTEALLVIVLTVIAGTGNPGANIAIGLLAVAWLLMLVTHKS